MRISFYILIVITGILSIYTDITQKKIKNDYLRVIFFCTVILYLLFFISGDLKLTPNLILNPIVALTAGFILYAGALWKAGDAKLFFVYSVLLPESKYSTIFPLPCIALFLVTFLLALLFVLPSLVGTIITHKDRINKEVLSIKAVKYFCQAFLITFGISWIISLILRFLSLENNVFLNFTLLFLGYMTVNKLMTKINSKFLLAFVFVTGFILRYIFMPESYSLPSLTSYFKYLLSFSVIFYILRVIIQVDAEKPKRIPFAPFMFLGVILSNTGFLWWAMAAISYLK